MAFLDNDGVRKLMELIKHNKIKSEMISDLATAGTAAYAKDSGTATYAKDSGTVGGHNVQVDVTSKSTFINPEAITINGTTYDGSEAVQINIQGQDSTDLLSYFTPSTYTLSKDGWAADGSQYKQKIDETWITTKTVIRNMTLSPSSAKISEARAAFGTITGYYPDAAGIVVYASNQPTVDITVDVYMNK